MHARAHAAHNAPCDLLVRLLQKHHLVHDAGAQLLPDGRSHPGKSARGAAREREWRTRFFFYEEIFFVGKNAVCKIIFFLLNREMQLKPANSGQKSWFTFCVGPSPGLLPDQSSI